MFAERARMMTRGDENHMAAASKYIMQSFQKSVSGKDKVLRDAYKSRLITWRKEHVVERIDGPTNPVRARSLGYKAKKGFAVARVRIRKGRSMKTRPNKGRRPTTMGVKKLKLNKSTQQTAEEKVSRKFPNLEILNSYIVGEDGVSKFFEVIMIDPTRPEIMNDKDISWIITETRRVFRGKTSASKKTPGRQK